MIAIESLPIDYVAFAELIVCSNRLVKVLAPFSIGGKVPLLVGKGPEPVIWLNMRSTKVASGWLPLVRANRSLHPDVKVDKTKNRRVSVLAKDSLIIDVLLHTEDSAEIEQLDLRPLGLNIYGDSNSLYIGTNQLSHNTFQNVRVMMGIGKD